MILAYDPETLEMLDTVLPSMGARHRALTEAESRAIWSAMMDSSRNESDLSPDALK